MTAPNPSVPHRPEPPPHPEPATHHRPDVIDSLAGIADGSPAWRVRQLRPKVAEATQACDVLIFSPALATGLTLTERLRAAHAVADAAALRPLAAHYAARLREQGENAPAPDASPRAQAIDTFARRVGQTPQAADRSALLALQDSGLSVPEIVLLAQLIGYVAYQGRLLAGVIALDNMGPAGAPAAQAVDAPEADFVHPANLPPPGSALDINGYTSRTLGWSAWLPVLDPRHASAAQNAVLDASHPKARGSDFYLLLAHQPEVLAQRSAAFNAIMYAPGGLSRAERELATAAVSRSNSCHYCLSVHAQRFEQLAKRNDVIAQLFAAPNTAGTTPRERAVILFALALTRRPAALGSADLLALRQAGLSDLEVLDTLHASALFAWANRLMLNLGEAVYPEADEA
ncbi:MAG: peroxidase-related enzyme [Comamonas sp.]